jgi:D-glycero-D-manno-heptose 1,7-bisphosphate phosphatase
MLYSRPVTIPPDNRRRAVFLDRDGTLAHEVGYVNHPDRFRLFAFAPRAVRILNEAGLRVIVITNQSGVARGYFTEEILSEVHRRLEEGLARGGASVDAIYYCPHLPSHDGDCECRKPLPGMLRRAEREFEIDLARSWVVGDMITDVEMGRAVGARTILLRTGYGLGQMTYQRDRWRVEPDLVCDNLLDAARRIASEAAGGAEAAR